MQVRTPAVAGMFYPENKEELKKSIKDCFLHQLGPGKLPPPQESEKTVGTICPHAGYPYSGPVACHSYYKMAAEPSQLYIIVGPNHWGIGCNVASMKDCKWETPLGTVEVDSRSAQRLVELEDSVELDFFSHTREHSLEVQVPMLQEAMSTEFNILPIAMIDQTKETAKKIGDAIAEIAKEQNAMIIGSSDFTHYEPHEAAEEKDHKLIEQVVKMDVDSFYDVLYDKKVTACGYGAIAATMVACRKLGAKKGDLLSYATSGDATGDKTSVVGYGSIVFN